MIKKKSKIINKLGLHARAASEFVRIAQKFSCEIMVTNDPATANGKSIISMMMLQAPLGTLVDLSCDGDDEQDAMDSLIQVIENRFGEEE